MKVVFVLEYEVVPGPDVEALNEQVGRGLSAMRTMTLGLEPVTSTYRGSWIAIRESADAVLEAVQERKWDHEPME